MKNLLCLLGLYFLTSAHSFASSVGGYRIQCTNYDYRITLIEGAGDKGVAGEFAKGDPKDEFRSIIDKVNVELKRGYTQNQSEIMYFNSTFRLVTRFNVQTMPRAKEYNSPILEPGFFTGINKFGKFKNARFFCIRQDFDKRAAQETQASPIIIAHEHSGMVRDPKYVFVNHCEVTADGHIDGYNRSFPENGGWKNDVPIHEIIKPDELKNVMQWLTAAKSGPFERLPSVCDAGGSDIRANLNGESFPILSRPDCSPAGSYQNKHPDAQKLIEFINTKCHFR